MANGFNLQLDEAWGSGQVGQPNVADPRVAFFFHMGFAISRWAYVDRDLFHIFRAMLGSNSEAVAAHLFFKSPSINDHFLTTGVARKFDGSKARRSPGRPRISREVEELIIRMASENLGWGYDLPVPNIRFDSKDGGGRQEAVAL